MQKKSFKSQASSSRAISGNPLTGAGFGSTATNTFTQGPSSTLSYIYEPPDLSTISDPAVGVSFKALQKKDSTTKYKALEDLQSYVAIQIENKETLEETILEAWTKLFPRTSIDNSNRVRQLAYILHGRIAVSCGKGFVKHMPSTVGAWLAGSFDRERQVARTARESLASTFTTEEKRRGVWKAFQESILEYCLDTVQKETVQTLSDERTSSPDDAQAKYSRAIGGALLTITGLLDVLGTEDLHKYTASYEQCLQSDAVWKLASSTDSGLRRAVYRLASTAITRLPDTVDLVKLGNTLLKQLSADQTGSAYEYIRALVQITRVAPEIWTTSYTTTSKKTSLSRFGSFLQKGSFGVGSEFYKELIILLKLLPSEMLLSDSQQVQSDAPNLLKCLREGIAGSVSGQKSVELQTEHAWQCFLYLADRLSTAARQIEQKISIATDGLLPIIAYYIDPDLVKHGYNWPLSKEIILQAFELAWRHVRERTTQEIEAISKHLVQSMQTSLPEQSKDFGRSQDAVVDRFRKWYDLQAAMLERHPETVDILTATARAESSAAIDLLKGRNSKPYGAAIVLEMLVIKIPQTSLRQHEIAENLQIFAQEVIPKSMQSPSVPAFLRLLEALKQTQDTRPVLDAAITELLAAPRSSTRSLALQTLATSYWPTDSNQSAELAAAVLEDLTAAVQKEEPTWNLPFAVLESTTSPPKLDQDILNTMMDGLSIDNCAERSIKGFNQLVISKNLALRSFANSPAGPELFSKLLYLSHQDDAAVQQQASNLRDAIGTLIHGTGVNTMMTIIRDSILKTDHDSLPIISLIEQALAYLKNLPKSDCIQAVSDLLPDILLWKESLIPFVSQTVNPAVSMKDALCGAVHLITPEDIAIESESVSYDADGYSAPLRAAIYTSRLLLTMTELMMPTESEMLAPIDEVVGIYSTVTVISLLESDHQWTSFKKPIRVRPSEDNEIDLTHILRDLRGFFDPWLLSSKEGKATLSLILGEFLHNSKEGTSTAAYYQARAYVTLAQALDEAATLLVEFQPNQEIYSRLRKGPDHFSDLASLTTSTSIDGNLKLFSELVSDLAATGKSEDGLVLKKYVTLNILLSNDLVEIEAVPKQRLVYFVKASVALLQKILDSSTLRAEIFKSLVILPALAEIYDEFWETIIVQCMNCLVHESDEELPTTHAVLRLLNILQKMCGTDVNEDLQEAWSKLKPELDEKCLDLLRHEANNQGNDNQAIRMVHDLLYRRLKKITPGLKTQAEDLTSILESKSSILQRAAFQILHPLLSTAQQQISIDAALTTEFVPRLPEKVMAMIEKASPEDECLELRTQPELPSSIARYLLAWKLILAHWNLASYKVRAAYVGQLKNGTYVDEFLAFAYLNLMELHGGRNKAGFDTTKIPSITSYEIDNSEDPETELLWLICNILYNILMHTPHLAKAWHANSCPRAIKSSVETWTSKNISPLIIDQELKLASEWTPPSDKPGSELTIKVAPKAAEVTASMPLDETSIAVKIHLPSSYPFAPINLITVQRMGIDEKKWQSFLNVSRIVMNFSGTSQGQGAVVDGISAWRDNVVGALDGHSECAICYSVVAEDGKVPNKKCATCGHLFHGLCLYKWFQRSAGSSCPLCRNSFVYA